MERRKLIAAAAAGIMLVVSFPPFRTGFFALGALVPLLFILETGGLRSAFAAGYAAGLVLSAGTLYWVTLPTAAGGIALILFLPVITGTVCVIYRFFRKHLGPRAVWLLPFLWTASEWLLVLGQLSFPWNMLGHTQSYYLPIIQFASVTGIAGVSFWVVLCNVTVFLLVSGLNSGRRRSAVVYSALLGGVILMPVLYGTAVIPRVQESNDADVALLQGNIDPYAKWDPAFVKSSFEMYLGMSRKAAAGMPELIIWPETAASTYLAGRRGRAYRARLHALVDSLGIPLFTGAPHYVYDRELKRMRYYNSAFLFTPGSSDLVSYDKIKLVPFSEKIPFEEEVPLLQKVNLGEADFSYGERLTVFGAGKMKFGTVICFESAFGGLVRGLVRAGAGVIVNITNDAWFGRTSGPYQHLQMAVFRAVENRVSIARCANSGISAVIGPYGRVHRSTGLFTRESLTAGINLHPLYETPYTRFGDMVSPGCAGVTLCAAVAAAAAGLMAKRNA